MKKEKKEKPGVLWTEALGEPRGGRGQVLKDAGVMTLYW